MDGVRVPCHMLVVSAASPVLRAMLEGKRFAEGQKREIQVSRGIL